MMEQLQQVTVHVVHVEKETRGQSTKCHCLHFVQEDLQHLL